MSKMNWVKVKGGYSSFIINPKFDPSIVKNLTEYPALQKIIVDTPLVVVNKENKVYLAKIVDNELEPIQSQKFSSLKDLNDHVDYNYTYFFGFYTHKYDYLLKKRKQSHGTVSSRVRRNRKSNKTSPKR